MILKEPTSNLWFAADARKHNSTDYYFINPFSACIPNFIRINQKKVWLPAARQPILFLGGALVI
jgi:hypothetical protein